MDHADYMIIGVGIFFLIIIFSMIIVFVFTLFIDNKVELGQAICNEKGLGDYILYSDGVLLCKEKPRITYDGLVIEVR